LRSKIARELEKMGKPTSISHYYWDKKAKDQGETQDFEGV
jgi:hypothetical protein